MTNNIASNPNLKEAINEKVQNKSNEATETTIEHSANLDEVLKTMTDNPELVNNMFKEMLSMFDKK
ncbi:hypothetical protein [Alkalihalobacillus sp. BA299]|uniref:hypothetical protein n=1 Tax=Alkalihalobacillus sp. BA299 TaxID=2815938 RepID=UPI001ADAD7B2|nr:hypothetical protein [Alkalihalobacillus sp. BA299]